MNDLKARRLVAIGELLIDFSGNRPGAIATVESFVRHPGGAPANVAVQFTKLGGSAKLITKLGADGFGDYLLAVMRDNHVDVTSIVRTDAAHTALAFVALAEDGERDFVFYRHPSSDMLLDRIEVKPSDFREGDLLHFCSVDLIDAPVRKAHDKALALALANHMTISFDPNLRFALWPDREALKKTVWEYLPFADILKVGEDEAAFLTGGSDETAWRSLMQGNVKLLIVTRGKAGASLFTNHLRIDVAGIPVQAVDATGAGDAFIAAFLYALVFAGVGRDALDHDRKILETALRYANKVAAIVVTKHGAIPSMPSHADVGDPS